MDRRSSPPRNWSRRRYLAAVGVAASGAVAGCPALDGDSTGAATTVARPAFEHPTNVRYDEPIPLSIRNLPAGASVAVTASTTDARDASWTASATYEVSDGSIALDADRPVQAAFDRAATTALIQSMQPEEGHESPYVPPDAEALTVSVSMGQETLGSTTIFRNYGDVTVTELDPAELLPGYLVEPPGSDPAPGVVVLHGRGGRPLLGNAKALAMNGFVAIAPQYFGGRGVPATLEEVPVEYVDEAAQWLLARERVSGSRVGLYGVSKGGELALLAGSHYESVRAVVSIAGSGVTWESFGSGSGSSWTIDGEPVPSIPIVRDPDEIDRTPPSEPDAPTALEPIYTASFEAAGAETIERSTIPVEDIDGPVLLVSGGDDGLWNAVRFSRVAMDRLDAHDRPYRDEHLVFPAAGHRITYPYQPASNRGAGRRWAYGGTTAGYARADRGHWPRALETLSVAGDD